MKEILERVVIVHSAKFQGWFEEATRITPDPENISYLALALAFDIPIWSRDVRLKEQNKVKILSTVEVVKLL